MLEVAGARFGEGDGGEGDWGDYAVEDGGLACAGEDVRGEVEDEEGEEGEHGATVEVISKLFSPLEVASCCSKDVRPECTTRDIP